MYASYKHLCRTIRDFEILAETDELDAWDETTYRMLREAQCELTVQYCEEELKDLQFILESEFEDYCYQFAIDSGMISSGTKIKANDLASYVDWERWAADCQHDYTPITIDGEDYLFQSP